MNQFKSWYTSLGVWGSLGTILVGILNAIHIAHSTTMEGDVNAWSASAGVVIGGLVSLWGRLRATKRIDTPVAPPTPPMFLLLLALLFPLCLLAGCGATPLPDYVAADRSTFDAVAPEYAAYVGADPLLGPEQKQRRQNTLDVWRMRLEHASTQPAPR